MRVRWIGLTLALVLVGGAAGYAVGALRRDEPASFATAAPVPAQDPSIPVLPARPYAPDIAYPALATDLTYRTHGIGGPSYRWHYDVPVGWTPEDVSPLFEVRWRPATEPTVGGYSLRVKLINNHQTNAEMVAGKEAAVTSLYDDVHVLASTDELLSFRYREPDTNRLRFNTFTWFTPPGGSTAEFEMSVVGRAVDRPVLASLREHVAASIQQVG